MGREHFREISHVERDVFRVASKVEDGVLPRARTGEHTDGAGCRLQLRWNYAGPVGVRLRVIDERPLSGEEQQADACVQSRDHDEDSQQNVPKASHLDWTPCRRVQFAASHQCTSSGK